MRSDGLGAATDIDDECVDQARLLELCAATTISAGFGSAKECGPRPLAASGGRATRRPPVERTGCLRPSRRRGASSAQLRVLSSGLKSSRLSRSRSARRARLRGSSCSAAASRSSSFIGRILRAFGLRTPAPAPRTNPERTRSGDRETLLGTEAVCFCLPNATHQPQRLIIAPAAGGSI